MVGFGVVVETQVGTGTVVEDCCLSLLLLLLVVLFPLPLLLLWLVAVDERVLERVIHCSELLSSDVKIELVMRACLSR